jgi:hypothetical protein
MRCTGSQPIAATELRVKHRHKEESGSNNYIGQYRAMCYANSGKSGSHGQVESVIYGERLKNNSLQPSQIQNPVIR